MSDGRGVWTGAEALSFVKKLIKEDNALPVVKKEVVGTFGIMDNGFANKINWVISHRKDRRHGVVDTPAVKDAYQEDLFNTMFRKWGTTK